MQLALSMAGEKNGGGFRLPSALPPFNTLTYRLFTILWMIAFALAISAEVSPQVAPEDHRVCPNRKNFVDI